MRSLPALAILLVASLCAQPGCATTGIEQRGAPERPFDVVIVPGCPSEDDGALSRCQLARAIWAAGLYERGWVTHFITSGSAVYSPYVEAEALAAAMTALGVPPERIYLEANALHTDENMYYSMRIARALGFRAVAVAAETAIIDCRMLLDYGQPCRGFSMDLQWVKRKHRSVPGVLEQVRAPRVAVYRPLAVEERRRVALTGRHRPPSFLLYLSFAFQRSNGEHWVPAYAPPIARVTWADRLRLATR